MQKLAEVTIFPVDEENETGFRPYLQREEENLFFVLGQI
jgi:hypothetical protein